MTESQLQQLKYPIGHFKRPQQITGDHIQQWIDSIEQFPHRLQDEIRGLDQEQLQWQYRPDGWTIQQLVHHCADSHMNAFIRFKLAATEDNPTIRPYDEHAWSLLADGKDAPTAYSEILLVGLHARWALLLKQLSPEDYRKTFFHPEHQTSFRLDVNLALYAWHGEHHLAHVKQAKQFRGKY
jgi:hypothetical protein